MLVFLLTVRIIDNYLSTIFFGTDAPGWFNDYYSFGTYILIFLLVWANKDDLKSYNIDSASFNILLFGGFILVLQLSEELFKMILLMTLLFFYWAKSKNLLYTTNEGSKYSFHFLAILIFVIGLAWLPVLLYSVQPRTSLQNIDLLAAFFQAYPGGVIFEEYLFRSFLWGTLRKLGFKEMSILFIQASLFWASHHRFLLLDNTYFFWIPLPIFTLILGLLVLKTKSLKFSAIAHFLFNFTSSIILQIYTS